VAAKCESCGQNDVPGKGQQCRSCREQAANQAVGDTLKGNKNILKALGKKGEGKGGKGPQGKAGGKKS
jgi:hypothetical protein